MLSKKSINRRQFLQRLGLALGGLGVSACSPRGTPNSPAPTSGTPALPPIPATLTPSPPPTATPSPSATPTATPTVDDRVLVGLAACRDYTPQNLSAALETLLDQNGFLQVVRPGSRVILKANLTGGAFYDSPDRPPAVETYVTHPALVGALAAACLDAGAARVSVVDGLGDTRNWDAWGYQAMAAETGVDLVDLCRPDPYPDYTTYPVGEGYLVYPRFFLNPILGEADAFISVAKLKMHHTTGVTLSLKNLIGLAPIEHYRRQPEDNDRSSLHDEVNGFDQRLPRVIIDLNRARPVDFALIDGIMTCEGAAGPWNATLNPLRPGLLVAGRDPVAVDAVGAALMGVEPAAETGTSPFLHGENHLTLAAQAGLGVNRLEQITVQGEAIADLRTVFTPVP